MISRFLFLWIFTLAKTTSKQDLILPPADPSSAHIATIRGHRVVLDFQLAAIFDVRTGVFNQAIKRNLKRFPTEWAFQLSSDEFDDLISQNVISRGEWGGRRKLPWAFTEHGVVMAASVLRSDRATAVLQMVVEVFVQTRRSTEQKQPGGVKAVLKSSSTSEVFGNRLQNMITRLLDAIVDHENDKSVRDEALEIFQQSINHIKSKLNRAGFENQELAAKAAKLLAEAEANKATASKTRAEADQIALRTMANRLRLVMEAEQAMARGELGGFMKVLDDLGKS